MLTFWIMFITICILLPTCHYQKKRIEVLLAERKEMQLELGYIDGKRTKPKQPEPKQLYRQTTEELIDELVNNPNRPMLELVEAAEKRGEEEHSAKVQVDWGSGPEYRWVDNRDGTWTQYQVPPGEGEPIATGRYRAGKWRQSN